MDTAGRGVRGLRARALPLRSRLVLLLLALLTVVCLAVGLLGQAALDVFLTRQLDEDLDQQVRRTLRAGVQGPDDPAERPDDGPQDRPEGRVAWAGNVSARLVDGHVVEADVIAGNGAHEALPEEDLGRIELLAHRLGDDAGGTRGTELGPVDAQLSTGGYRVQAVDDPWELGSVLVGLPTEEKQDTLNSFRLASAGISVLAIGGTGLMGLVLVRRTLQPLEELADVATRVSELDLDHGEIVLPVDAVRTSEDPGTEVGRLGHAFGLMLGNVAHALTARQRSETRVRRFVADASHELRTPLASVRGYAELIRLTEPMSPQGRTSLSRVESEAARMTALVEDLLLLARLDEGRPVVAVDVDLLELVVETVSDARVTARGHDWRMRLPDEPVLVRGDPAQLRQVLINLLANAHQHTPEGTTVTAGLAAEDGWVALEVADDGPGIDPQFLDHIFSRFAREDDARAGTTGGSGLGLSIVEAIVGAHHGTVTVDSAPGSTCFTVRLPAAAG
ncbi:sensor histidine kinase [Kocuria flava]|uniref:sensor histidine kinase n=1 Tax=Kocuria flava TaxID=446860 RepID=UPI003F19AAD5